MSAAAPVTISLDALLPESPAEQKTPPLRSVHSASFAQGPNRQGKSAAVTIYHAGGIVIDIESNDEVEERFVTQAMAEPRWPEAMCKDPKRIAKTYELPNEALNRAPAEMQQLASDIRASSAINHGSQISES